MGLAGQGRRADQRGYAMAALLIGLSVMSVLMAAALPVWSHATRREREDELIWRGEQYRRAIMLFQRKYANTFPPSVDILVEQKFLRKKYQDPITGEDFQIIPVGAAVGGVPGQPGGGRPGVGGQTGPAGGAGSSGFGGQRGTGGQSGFGSPGAGGQSGFGTQAGFGTQGGFGAQGAGGQGGFAAQGSFGTQPGGLGQVGGGVAGTQPNMGIQGVTSKSKETSIKRYNNMDKYNQWAFVYLAASGQAGVGGAQFARPGQGMGPQGGFGQPGGGFGQPGGTTQPGGGSGFGQPGSRPPVPGGFGAPAPTSPGSSPFRPGSFGQPPPPR